MPQCKPIRVVLFGAGGRMGAAVLSSLAKDDRFELAAAILRNNDDRLGNPVPGYPGQQYVADIAAAAADVAIDFTRAGEFDSVLAQCRAWSLPLVSGTTALTPSQIGAIDSAARGIAVLWTSNFSIGIALLHRLAAIAAVALPEFDCSILETHRRGKLDAPSGTALALGEEIGRARGQGSSPQTGSASNSGRRAETGEVSFHSMRLGDTVGEHVVSFAGPSERVELVHRALDRAVFAEGALRAAHWLAGRAAGRYAMDDLLDSAEGREERS